WRFVESEEMNRRLLSMTAGHSREADMSLVFPSGLIVAMAPPMTPYGEFTFASLAAVLGWVLVSGSFFSLPNLYDSLLLITLALFATAAGAWVSDGRGLTAFFVTLVGSGLL